MSKTRAAGFFLLFFDSARVFNGHLFCRPFLAGWARTQFALLPIVGSRFVFARVFSGPPSCQHFSAAGCRAQVAHSLRGAFASAPAVGEAVRARPFCGFAAEVWSGRLFGRCFPATGSRAPLGGLSPPLCLRGGSCLFGSTGRRCEPRTSCRFFCEGRRHVHSAAAPLPQGGIAPPFWPLTRYRPLQVGIF